MEESNAIFEEDNGKDSQLSFPAMSRKEIFRKDLLKYSIGAILLFLFGGVLAAADKMGDDGLMAAVFSWMGIVFFGFVLLKRLFLGLFFPGRMEEIFKKEDERKGFLGKISSTQKIVGQDVEVFGKIRRSPKMLVSLIFLLAVFVVFLVLGTKYKFLVIGFFAVGAYTAKALNLPEVMLFILGALTLFWGFSFVINSFSALNFLIWGGMLAKEKDPGRSIIASVIGGYFRVIHLILIVSLFWAFILFFRRKDERSVSGEVWGAIRDVGLLVFMKTFKYYIYLALCQVTFGDKRGSFKENMAFLNREKGNLVAIFIKSGASLVALAIFFLGLFFWNLEYAFADMKLIAIGMGISMAVFLMARFSSEQLSFIVNYVEVRKEKQV